MTIELVQPEITAAFLVSSLFFFMCFDLWNLTSLSLYCLFVVDCLSYLLVLDYKDVERVETAYWKSQRQTIAAFLHANAVLNDWPFDRVREYAGQSSMRLYRKGDVIVHQAAALDYLYVIVQGECSVQRSVEVIAYLSWPSGYDTWETVETHEMRTVTLTALGRHDLVGEDAVCTPKALSSVTVRCQSEWLEVLMLPTGKLKKMLTANSKVMCRQRLKAYDAVVLHKIDALYHEVRADVIMAGRRIPLHGSTSTAGRVSGLQSAPFNGYFGLPPAASYAAGLSAAHALFSRLKLLGNDMLMHLRGVPATSNESMGGGKPKTLYNPLSASDVQEEKRRAARRARAVHLMTAIMAVAAAVPTLKAAEQGPAMSAMMQKYLTAFARADREIGRVVPAAPGHAQRHATVTVGTGVLSNRPSRKLVRRAVVACLSGVELPEPVPVVRAATAVANKRPVMAPLPAPRPVAALLAERAAAAATASATALSPFPPSAQAAALLASLRAAPSLHASLTTLGPTLAAKELQIQESLMSGQKTPRQKVQHKISTWGSILAKRADPPTTVKPLINLKEPMNKENDSARLSSSFSSSRSYLPPSSGISTRPASGTSSVRQ
jgi:hypothetical protein